MSTPPPSSAPPGRGWAGFRQRHLFDYSEGAVRLWLSLALVGVPPQAWALLQALQWPASQQVTIAGWLAVLALAAAFPIPIPRSKLSVSAGDILILLLLALAGPAAAVLAAAVEATVATRRTSKRLTSHVASPAASALAMTAAGALFVGSQRLMIGGGLPEPAAHIAALALAALLYSAVGSVLLMLLLSIKQNRRWTLSDWFASSNWLAALALASAVGAGLLSLQARQFGQATVAVAVVMMGLSLALLRMQLKAQIQAHEQQEARVRSAEQHSRDSQQRFHAAFSQASIGMAIVDADGTLVQGNQALHDLLGHTRQALVGRPFRGLLHSADADLLDRHAGEVIARRREGCSIELRCVAADGRDIWVSMHVALFDTPDDGARGLIYQLYDITSRRHAESELRHIAYHDALTGLANRNGLQERLAVAVEHSREDRRRRFAVMLLDLDRFKIVNDSLGHPAGDALLKEVAQRLRHCVRPADLVARLGGDEFAILLEDVDIADDVMQLGARLLQALAQPMIINGTDLRPQASIGITLSDMGYREADEILRDVDLAMYRAKADGKGRLAVFDTSMHEELGHRLQLETDLRLAIGEGRLSLAYQPLYRLDPQQLCGFEALARWNHPERGAISPGVFIALAEESGCITALTAWAVDEAVRQHAAWLAGRHDASGLVMHVNVSGHDLAQPGFVEHVLSALQRHGLPAPQLVLEITESTLMAHREQALQALGVLCAHGVKVGIDDFGTGYSSLAYLSTLPFDCLKIDRSFVSGMDRSPQNLEIVRAIVSLGRTLNKSVVAEGIETAAQLQQLLALGATVGQGYLLSRPLTVTQVGELLNKPALAPV